MGRPRSSQQRVRLSISMQPELRDRLERLALGHGMWHGDLASVSQMITRMIQETSDPLEGIEYGEIIAHYLHGQQPFRATYRSARGNEHIYEVCGGQIVLAQGIGQLLAIVPVPPEGRQSDSPELPMSWLLRLDRISSVVPIDAKWVDVPRALASLRLLPGVAAGYRPHPDDQSTEPQDDGSLIVRRWYSHRWPIRQMLLSLGPTAELLSPSSFREAMAAETLAVARAYNPVIASIGGDTDAANLTADPVGS